MLQCYSWKKSRRKNTDKPWISDGLRASIKKRASIFRESGHCKRWKKIDKAIKKTLSFRKSEYNKRQKEKLEVLAVELASGGVFLNSWLQTRIHDNGQLVT